MREIVTVLCESSKRTSTTNPNIVEYNTYRSAGIKMTIGMYSVYNRKAMS